MRTLEVVVLDPKAGGGAMRAAIMISLRRRVERLKTVELYRSTRSSTI
jgi:hypothetical protein